MDKYTEKFVEIDKKFKNNPTPAERKELEQEFWRTAVEAFNENIAGDVTTVTGVTITIPKFEI